MLGVSAIYWFTWKTANDLQCQCCPFSIDWFRFYFFVRNSLVALLEALFDRILFRFEISFCWHCLCARVLSLTNAFLPRFDPSQPGSCAWLSPFLLCADHTCVLVRVCLCMCVWKCVSKVTNVNKYKENRDDVTCSTTTSNPHGECPRELENARRCSAL